MEKESVKLPLDNSNTVKVDESPFVASLRILARIIAKDYLSKQEKPSNYPDNAHGENTDN